MIPRVKSTAKIPSHWQRQGVLVIARETLTAQRVTASIRLLALTVKFVKFLPVKMAAHLMGQLVGVTVPRATVTSTVVPLVSISQQQQTV